MTRHSAFAKRWHSFGSAYREGKREEHSKVVQMVLSGQKQEAIASTMAL